jgi:serralysin
MVARIGLLLIASLLAWPVGGAHAATLHIRTSGDDRTGDGSAARPWKSPQKALENVNPGDTVLLGDGVYVGDLSIRRGGAEGAYVVLRSDHSRLAKIVGMRYSAINVKANYVEIDGLDIKSAEGHGIAATDVHHIHVLRNRLHHCGGSGFQGNSGDYYLVEDNIADHNAATNRFHCSGISIYQARAIADKKPGIHNIVRGNLCYANMEVSVRGDHTDGNGIIIDDFHNSQGKSAAGPYPFQTLVENNLCYDNGSKGIHVYLSDHVTVCNNTCYWNNRDEKNQGTWRAELSNIQASDNRWSRNIAWANPDYHRDNMAILDASMGRNDQNAGVVWSDNLTYNGKPGQSSVRVINSPSTITAANGNQLGVDPRFVRPAVEDGDFHVRSDSSAVDAKGKAKGALTALQKAP